MSGETEGAELWVVLRTRGIPKEAAVFELFPPSDVSPARRYKPDDPCMNVTLAEGPASSVWPRVQSHLQKVGAELAGPGRAGSVDVGTTLGADGIMKSVSVPPKVLALCGALDLTLDVSIYVASD